MTTIGELARELDVEPADIDVLLTQLAHRYADGGEVAPGGWLEDGWSPDAATWTPGLDDGDVDALIGRIDALTGGAADAAAPDVAIDAGLRNYAEARMYGAAGEDDAAAAAAAFGDYYTGRCNDYPSVTPGSLPPAGGSHQQWAEAYRDLADRAAGQGRPDEERIARSWADWHHGQVQAGRDDQP